MISIDWTHRRLRVVVGKQVRDNWTVEQARSAEIPSDLDMGDPAQLGAFLKDRLKEWKVKEKRAVSCIPRRHVILKTVSLAGVDETETSEVLRLQAMRELTLPVEEAVIDYVRFDDSAGDSHALLAAARHELIDFYRQAFHAAGLKLVGLWPEQLAQVQFMAQRFLPLQSAGSDESLLATVDDHFLQLTLLKGRRFLASVARSLGNDGADAALRSIRRLRSTLLTQFPELDLSALRLAGRMDAHKDVCDALQEEFAVPLEVVDPVEGIENPAIEPREHSSFATTVGSMLSHPLDATQTVNFLSPKRTQPKQDRRRLIAIVGVGLAMFGLMQVHRYVEGETERLATEKSRATKETSKLNKQLKSMKEPQEQLALLEEWREGEVVWLTAVDRFFELMPESEVFLTSMNLSRSSRESGSATVRIEGFATSPQAVAEATRRLVHDGGFIVRPGPIQPSDRFTGYTRRFSADITIPAEALRSNEEDEDEAGDQVAATSP